MKKIMIIALVVLLVLSISIGVVAAKPKNPAHGKTAAQLKVDSKKEFKAGVASLLATIKDNRRLWGQAGGLDGAQDIAEQVGDEIDEIKLEGLVLTEEQLAAIKAERDKITSLKLTLRTEKAALQAAWKSYIRAKKNIDLPVAVTALNEVIRIQNVRIQARKDIFASLQRILEILEQAALPPAPESSPSTSTEPSPEGSPSSEPSPSV